MVYQEFQINYSNKARVDDSDSIIHDLNYGRGNWEEIRQRLFGKGMLILGTQRKSPRLLEPPPDPGPCGVLDALLEERREGR